MGVSFCLFGLLDHLVGAGEEGLGHFEAESLGGFQIDHQLDLGGRLNWKIGRLLALQDAINVTCRVPDRIDPIRTVGHQATEGDGETIAVHRGQLVPGRKRRDEIEMNRAGRARCDD